jgi:hypothetical protein
MAGSALWVSKSAGGFRPTLGLGLSPQLDASTSTLASARSLIGDLSCRIVDLLLPFRSRGLVDLLLLSEVSVSAAFALGLVGTLVSGVIVDDRFVIGALGNAEHSYYQQCQQHVGDDASTLLANDSAEYLPANQPPNQATHVMLLQSL